MEGRISKYWVILSAVLLLGGGGLVLANEDDEGRRQFDNADVRGAYGFSFSGTVFVEVPVEGQEEPQLVPVQVASTGRFRSEGNGNIPEGSRTLNINGTVLEQTFTCIYQVERDGRGRADCPVHETGTTESFSFVINSQNREIQFVGTTPGAVVLGVARRQ